MYIIARCWNNLSLYIIYTRGSWLHGSWIYNYLCNQCLSLLMLWVQIPLRRGVIDTTLCDKVLQWPTTGQWFSLGTPVSSTNKTGCHVITEILLKVALNTITLNLTLCFKYLILLTFAAVTSLYIKHTQKYFNDQEFYFSNES